MLVSAIGADVKGTTVEVEALAVVDEIEPEPKVRTISGAVTNSCRAGSVSVHAKFLPLCKA
jgi:hypothetical protein